VPQLVVVIKKIATDTNASVTVKDPTGEMQGTIHNSALDIHPNLIKRGAVLFLRQVSTLMSPSLLSQPVPSLTSRLAGSSGVCVHAHAGFALPQHH
jgi:hypothetical protein